MIGPCNVFCQSPACETILVKKGARTMTTQLETLVLIRVQARGGKYLGPNVQYSQVTIWNGDQRIFGPITASGGSGTVDPQANGPFPAKSSPNAIVVTGGSS